MHSSLVSLARLLTLTACGRPSGEGALFRAAAFAGPPELQVAGQLAEEQYGVRWAAALGHGAGLSPRLVIASPETTEAQSCLANLGVESNVEGFRYLNRDFTWRTDVVVAVLEDPERAGLPLTCVVGGGEETLAPLAANFAVGYRPSLRILREGTSILEVTLGPDGKPRLGSLLEHQPTWTFNPAAYQVVEAAGLAAHASKGLPADDVRDYLERCAAARGRARTWSGQTELATPRLYLELGMDELPRAVVWDRWARSVRAGRGAEGTREAQGAQIHGLLIAPREGSGHARIDDGGAALVENDLRSHLGPCAYPWLPEAAAVEAAGTWFGRRLEEWALDLQRAELVPAPLELMDERALVERSPHMVMPLRALLVRSLRDDVGVDMVSFWKGTAVEPSDELWESAWKAKRDAWAQALAAQPDQAPALGLEKPLFGVRLGLEAGSIERGAGSTLARLALNDLSTAGGRAMLLDMFVPALPGLGAGQGLESEPRLRCMAGDIAVCLAIADARARDQYSVLCAHQLTSPEGTFFAGLKRTSSEEIEAFFVEYRRFAEHAALLARASGADLLALGGEGTGSLGDTEGQPAGAEETPYPEDPLEAVLRGARREGWAHTLRGLRTLAGTRLTWVAPTLPMAERFGFWSELDTLAVPFRPDLGGESFGPGTRGPLPETPTRARMRGRLEAVASFAEETGRSWMLIGTGFRATSGAWRGEMGGALGSVDIDEQRRLWRSFAWAYHQAAGEGRAPDGLIVDRWQVDLFAPSTTRSYDVRGKQELWPLLRGVWRP